MAMYPCLSLPSLSFPTLTGSIVTFNAQYALPLYSHKIALTATQSGSGTPSPSNPRPIMGYSAINISHSDADTSNPTVYTITIGSTVYGGNYDARTGVLTVTHEGEAIKDISFSRHTTYGSFYANLSSKYVGVGDLWCECFNPLTGSFSTQTIMNQPDNSIGQNRRNSNIYIHCDTYTSVADFKTALGDYLIMFELATPTTIQLPPCPIDTIANSVNNIWADTGDTTLQYPKFG